MNSAKDLSQRDPLLTVHDLSELLKVHKRTIWRWLQQKRLPQPIRYSRGSVRWKLSVVQAFLDSFDN